MNRWVHEVLELTRVRTRIFLREPEAVFWVFAFPVILAAVLGFAFRSSEPEPSPCAVLPGPGAEALAETLGAAPGIEVRSGESEALWRGLRNGSLDILVESLALGTDPILHLNPGRPETETARLRVERALMTEPPTSLAVTPMTEPGSRYVDFLFPGLIGMNLMGTGMWSIGFAVADMRQKKLLKRLLVTPMRRSSLLASFLLSRLVFLTLELIVLVGFAVFALGVPFHGSVIGFTLIASLGAVVFAGLGLLTAARAQTIEGVSGLMNLVMVPMWLGSGVFFSYERFPEVIHPILRLLPLTALNDGLRAMMVDGDVITAILPEFGILMTWGVLGFLLALKIFRWK